MSFHIITMIIKVAKIQNKCSLYRCFAEGKCAAYTSLVKALLEYGSVEYLQKDNKILRWYNGMLLVGSDTIAVFHLF